VLYYCIQVVCSLGSNATTRPSDDVLETTVATGSATDDNVVMATGAVGVARCELTAPISNASSTFIQLVFDVVHIEHVDVCRVVNDN